jgi:hypothetical protein
MNPNNPAPDDQHAPPTSNANHRRNGKVARLPKELRELVNVMLADGAPYPLIIQKLADQGHTLKPDNLSRWHAGGYQDWLKEQSWLEAMRARLDFAADIVQHPNGDLIEAASLRIAIIQMYRLLAGFDPVVLEPKISQQPSAYVRILTVLCKLTDGAVKLERHRQNKARYAALAPTPIAVNPARSDQL